MRKSTLTHLSFICLFFSFAFLTGCATVKTTFILEKTWGGRGTLTGKFVEPRGIAVDSRDYVYVCDSGNSRIQVFDGNGNFIRSWGEKGSGKNQLGTPYCIAVGKSGDVYVLELSNNRIQQFDASGKSIRFIGGPGSGDGQFKNPLGLAIDDEDRLYVADKDNSRVQVFDRDGKFQFKFGEKGINVYNSNVKGEGRFSYPMALDVKKNGKIFVGDYMNGVQVFSSRGVYEFTIIPSRNHPNHLKYRNGRINVPGDLKIGSNGWIYVVDNQDSALYIFNVNGGLFQIVSSSFNHPSGLAIDSRGNIYISDTANNQVKKFN